MVIYTFIYIYLFIYTYCGIFAAPLTVSIWVAKFDTCCCISQSASDTAKTVFSHLLALPVTSTVSHDAFYLHVSELSTVLHKMHRCDSMGDI